MIETAFKGDLFCQGSGSGLHLWDGREKSSSSVFHLPRCRGDVVEYSQPRRITKQARRKKNKEL